MEEDENESMHIIRAAAGISDSGQKVSLSASNRLGDESCTGGWSLMHCRRRRICNYDEGWMICCSSGELKSKEESSSVGCTQEFSTYR